MWNELTQCYLSFTDLEEEGQLANEGAEGPGRGGQGRGGHGDGDAAHQEVGGAELQQQDGARPAARLRQDGRHDAHVTHHPNLQNKTRHLSSTLFVHHNSTQKCDDLIVGGRYREKLLHSLSCKKDDVTDVGNLKYDVSLIEFSAIQEKGRLSSGFAA